MTQTNKAWRVFVGTMLLALLLFRDKLEAPPPASIGHHQVSSTSFGSR